MAHVTNSKNGYYVEPIDNMFVRDNEARKFYIYRPINERIATALSDAATSNKTENIKVYSILPVAVRLGGSGLGTGQINMEKDYSEKNCCSQFVCETIKSATTNISNHEYYPEIYSKTTPHLLESMLREKYNLYEAYVCNPVEDQGNIRKLPSIYLKNKIDKTLTNYKKRLKEDNVNINALNTWMLNAIVATVV
jgi:hypothetical protein